MDREPSFGLRSAARSASSRTPGGRRIWHRLAIGFADTATAPRVTVPLSIAIAVSAVLAIIFSERGNRRGVYLFKPLATGLILALALLGEGDGRYRALIALGLVFSLAGDVFLMLPRDRFVAGLASFLVAHLLYAAAFGWHGSAASAVLLLPFAAWGLLLLRALWPRLGPLRAPVLAYAAALMAMAWLACVRAGAGIPGALPAAAGAALFVLSDSALAFNRFRRPLRHAQALVLGTYFAAQWLIALSVHG